MSQLQKSNLQEVLRKLDEIYGITKEGFYHQQDWQLLIAIMLSAQSTDKQVDQALPALFQRYVHVQDMAEAPVEEIESYIRSIGLYKNKAKNSKLCCQQIIEQYNGQVPDTMEKLLTLAGVGRKTANLFLADAHEIPGITVDTHVFRIAKRLGWAKGKNPLQVEKELQKVLPKEHWIRINFQLIYHGRAICTSRKAYCEKCPLEQLCPKVDVNGAGAGQGENS
ncbi:MAG: endonuclease III [Roseburia sp.]|nr:endonuclease III [Roseburia sp.]MCM1278342.1 endonuclease III [Robinsoniella sp.]